jgi:hypothetical protein
MLEQYQPILEALQKVEPLVHIAGGAVRDTILGKPIQDIDIFADDAFVETIAELLRSRFGYVKVGEWKQYLGFSDPAMTRVAKFEKAEETIPICIIGLKWGYITPKANIGRFDFGICMPAFDGENIIKTEKFDTDVENKTFTLYRADNIEQFIYSMSRYKKITAGRYAGWELVIPKVFEEFAKERAFREHWYKDWDKGFDGESVLKPKERAAA